MKLKFLLRTAAYYPEYMPLVSTKYNDVFIDELSYVPARIYEQRKRAQEQVKGREDTRLFWVPLEYIKIN